MVSGKAKTLIDAITNDQYGVFSMTAGGTWCGEWTGLRESERERLLQEEKERDQEIEAFAKSHPGELVRLIK
jgi:hypothetical protein